MSVPPDRPHLDVGTVLAAGRARWPGVRLRPPDLRATLAADPSRLERARPRHLGDLYLAVALERGHPAARRVYARRFEPELRAALHNRSLPWAKVGPILAALRHRLATDPLELRRYAGRESLDTFLIRCALAAAHRFLERRQDPSTEPDEVDDRYPALDPELMYMKNRYGSTFRLAFRRALDELTDFQRRLLAAYLVEGRSLARIAEAHFVHQNTAQLWIDGARRLVLDHTRTALVDLLACPDSVADEVIQLFGDDLDDITIDPQPRRLELPATAPTPRPSARGTAPPPARPKGFATLPASKTSVVRPGRDLPPPRRRPESEPV